MEFIDLKAQYDLLKEEIDKGIANVLSHGQFIMGPEVILLEQQLADYVGRRHCVTCANGTDALQMTFMAYGIGAGDAVFCPDVTFIASVEPACMLGATPVFCDITADTYNICPTSLEAQIKAVLAEGRYRPAAVVAVDFLGNPADYDALEAICNRYDVILIEDAAQSMGASYHGRKCGSWGDIATTSFFPAKPLGCYGDGGAIFTDDNAMADLLRSLRVHGKGPGGKYDNIRIGLNSRLDTLQAAILLPKLAHLEEEVVLRQQIASHYNATLACKYHIPFVSPGCVSVYAQYALLATSKLYRDATIETLKAQDIPNMIYYPTPQHMLPVFAGIPSYGMEFSNAVKYTENTFSLPMSGYINSVAQEHIIEVLLHTK